MPPVDTLTLHQAADRLGVHYMTVYRWVRTGRLPAHRSGVEWRVDPADVERAAHRADPPRGGTGGDVGARGRPRARAAAATRLRHRMTAGDEVGAWTVIEETMASGASPADVYLEVVAPALEAVGAGWAGGTISVAEEHRATMVASRLLGRMGPHFARPGRTRGTILLGAPAGDAHALPGSLLGDVLRGAGFAVIDLGADTPAESFVESARGASRLVAVLVGVTRTGNDATVQATIAALHDAALGAPVLVGGGGVPDAAHALLLGGDRWSGPSARSALDLLEEISPRS
jgi:excisionase family DNA binding protein